jgi:hypothetical protein
LKVSDGILKERVKLERTSEITEIAEAERLAKSCVSWIVVPAAPSGAAGETRSPNASGGWGEEALRPGFGFARANRTNPSNPIDPMVGQVSRRPNPHPTG